MASLLPSSKKFTFLTAEQLRSIANPTSAAGAERILYEMQQEFHKKHVLEPDCTKAMTVYSINKCARDLREYVTNHATHGGCSMFIYADFCDMHDSPATVIVYNYQAVADGVIEKLLLHGYSVWCQRNAAFVRLSIVWSRTQLSAGQWHCIHSQSDECQLPNADASSIKVA